MNGPPLSQGSPSQLEWAMKLKRIFFDIG